MHTQTFKKCLKENLENTSLWIKNEDVICNIFDAVKCDSKGNLQEQIIH